MTLAELKASQSQCDDTYGYREDVTHRLSVGSVQTRCGCDSDTSTDDDEGETKTRRQSEVNDNADANTEGTLPR